MIRSIFAVLVLVFSSNYASADDLPNIVLILADDLGYSDLGCYGGEISTPNLNGLAENGVRFSHFYNTGRCWPTRASLMTGFYPQQVRRDTIPGYAGRGQDQRPKWAKTIAQMLQQKNYRSYHSGKWHVDGRPVNCGFNESYRLADHDRFFGPKRHFENSIPVKGKFSESYYATTAIADHAIDCLDNHRTEFSDQPFFSFVAFTAPHFPLHALPEDIQKYTGKYRDGWEKMRERRWDRIQQLGALSTSLSNVERDLGPPYHFPNNLDKLGENEVFKPTPWDELSVEQKRFQAAKMELHAAMIDRMDQEIGRIVEQLKKNNAFENTLIMFLSDNGASAEIMVRGDGHQPESDPGSASSFLCLGPGGATVANTPFRRHKTWVHEGGISTPLIVHWPAGLAQRRAKSDGAALAGSWCSQVGHVIDVVPTILDVAGLETDFSKLDKDGEHTNVPSKFSGHSLMPFLHGEKDPKRVVWWCHDGHRALRDGHWKLVANRGEEWELYDLRVDRAEANNLADSNSERVKAMAQKWNEMALQFATDASRKKLTP